MAREKKQAEVRLAITLGEKDFCEEYEEYLAEHSFQFGNWCLEPGEGWQRMRKTGQWFSSTQKITLVNWENINVPYIWK